MNSIQAIFLDRTARLVEMTPSTTLERLRYFHTFLR